MGHNRKQGYVGVLLLPLLCGHSLGKRKLQAPRVRVTSGLGFTTSLSTTLDRYHLPSFHSCGLSPP